MRISHLYSGGLVVNYVCSSACAHCSYRSSPKRDRAYITYAQALDNCRTVRRLGCRSVHIGGGEPFLDRDGLFQALAAARDAGVGIDYIETNSSWYRDHAHATALLRDVRRAGCDTLLISIDPFHNAHIPFNKVKGAMAACRDAGVGIFPWRMEFFDEVNEFEDTTTHSLDEYVTRYGDAYLPGLGQRYGPSLSGRAVSTFAPFMEPEPLTSILAQGRRMGRGLTETGHFHVDLYGNYLPTGFPGFTVAIEDLGGTLPADRYPAATTLYRNGLEGLLDLARSQYGFTPRDTYRHPRELLDTVAGHLVRTAPKAFPDLGPTEYYTIDNN